MSHEHIPPYHTHTNTRHTIRRRTHINTPTSPYLRFLCHLPRESPPHGTGGLYPSFLASISSFPIVCFLSGLGSGNFTHPRLAICNLMLMRCWLTVMRWWTAVQSCILRMSALGGWIFIFLYTFIHCKPWERGRFDSAATRWGDDRGWQTCNISQVGSSQAIVNLLLILVGCLGGIGFGWMGLGGKNLYVFVAICE